MLRNVGGLNRSTPIRTLQLQIESGIAFPEGSHLWQNVQYAYKLAIRQAADRTPYKYRDKSDKGCVIYGGGKYLPGAYIVARALRHVGWQLPIELHYLGEKNEGDEASFNALWAYDVKPVDLSQQPERVAMHEVGGWYSKALAIRAAGFCHVLYLDTDCYPVRDPTRLFEDPEYIRTGAWFFPDRPGMDLSPQLLGQIGLNPSHPWWCVESGQLLVDTVRCARELDLAIWINDHHDYYYKLFWGDKESFPVAWRMMNTAYAMTQHRWAQEGPALLHYDFEGRPIFCHRAQDKPVLVATNKGELFPHTIQMYPQSQLQYCPELPMEALIHSWLKQYLSQVQ